MSIGKPEVPNASHPSLWASPYVGAFKLNFDDENWKVMALGGVLCFRS